MHRFPISRRGILSAGLAASMLPASRIAFASGLPQARIVIGFPPGGMPDTISRRISEYLSTRHAGAVTVDNRAGAGGQIAIQSLKGTPADGSVILLSPGSMLSIYPHTYKKLAYDPVADLTPVAQIGSAIPALAVGPQVPASVTDVRSFVQWVKANPALASYGSPAPGSMLHFAGLMFAKEGGFELQHVPYRGTQPALLDLMAGRLPAVISTQGEFLTQRKAGNLRVLGVASAKRTAALPDVVTFAEQGFPSVVAADYIGFYLPAGAPKAVVDSLHANLQAAVATAPLKRALEDTGIEPIFSTPEQLGQLVRSELARWAPIVKASGFTADS